MLHRHESKTTAALRSLTLLCAVVLDGCQPATSGVNSSNQRSVGLHELDHEIPAHRPHDFRDALEAIAELDGALRAGESVEAYDKLYDIIRWLPEIAAETELAEPEWNTIDQASQKLLSYLPRPPLENQQPYLDVADQVVAVHKQLAPLAASVPSTQNNQSNPPSVESRE